MPGLSLGRIWGPIFGAPSIRGICVCSAWGCIDADADADADAGETRSSEKISSLCSSTRTGTGAGVGTGWDGEEEAVPEPNPFPILIPGSDVLMLSNPDERSVATCCIGDLGDPNAPAVALPAIDSFIVVFLSSSSAMVLLSCKFSSKSDFEGEPCGASDNNRFDSNNFDFKFSIFDSSSGISISIYTINRYIY